jgi:hypothetical protein
MADVARNIRQGGCDCHDAQNHRYATQNTFERLHAINPHDVSQHLACQLNKPVGIKIAR